MGTGYRVQGIGMRGGAACMCGCGAVAWPGPMNSHVAMNSYVEGCARRRRMAEAVE